jgi:GalNAc-alpha-(1->4)-GalNAc-alpha-(1->3)-diNAcBac-PP-undecaprenol alpha-1,4-N-acetyl-D-galactosaminyltransferase
MNKAKICLIIPSLRNGGSERVMSLLANEWVKNKNKNVNIYLILLTKQKKYYDLHKDVTLIEPNISYKKTRFSKLLYKAWTLFYIRRVCNKIDPDSILSFNERYNNIVLLSLIGTPYKKYISDRNNPFNSLGFIHNMLRKVLYRKASGIISQTTTAKELLFKSTGNKNIKVIPNPLRKIKSSNLEKRNTILNIGRLVEQKNQLELIEIFSMCDYKNWILKIYGSGHLKEQLKKKIKELNLYNNVELNDFTQDIDTAYSRAKIFALTSLYEGFPNVLIEAMAHGLPSISYDCQTGPKDIINNKVNGFLVPFSDKNIFVEKLSALMKSEELRSLFSVESKRVNQLYSLEMISDKYYYFIMQHETNN